MKRIFDILKNGGAADVAVIKFADCEIINEKLLSRLDFTPQSVIIGTVPYYTEFSDKTKIVSSYALAYDYHLFFKEIERDALALIKETFPEYSFKFFGDHSPINEKAAAAKAGLGIIGKNQLIITPAHSSFVFLFENMTDMECDAVCGKTEFCIGCNRCINACPSFLRKEGECLSAITQKKGELNDDEIKMIIKYQTVWGCDICQQVCPYTQKAIESGSIYSKLEWFNSNIRSIPDEESICDTNDFPNRAYSWRGKAVILRNINILNGKKQ